MMNKSNEKTDLLRLALKSNRGRDIEYFDEISSTNTYLIDMAKQKSANHRDRALVVAGSQSHGKGRLGRTFVSPPDAGIYMSVLFTHADGKRLLAESALILTIIAGVAVAETLNEYDAERGFHIKWVNDVLHGDKKICGILAETMIVEYPYIEYAILGIGINMRKSAYPADVASVAVSLEEAVFSETAVIPPSHLTDFPLNETIIASVLEKIDDMWDSYLISNDSAAIISRYRQSFRLIGRTVNVIPHGQGSDTWTATVKGIDDGASLIVTDENGNDHTLISGEISVKLQS